MALVHILPITAVVLALLYYWFAAADRYRVFLYYHDMGPVVPDTSPFSFVTASRYWMAGLVASGAVMVLYVPWNGIAGRLATDYDPPPWWRVWLPSAAALAVVVGLAVALIPGRFAARHPARLIMLAADGWGLALVMSSLVGLQHARRWLASGSTGYLLWMAAIVAAAIAWLLLLTGLYVWRRWPVPHGRDSLMAGIAVAYVLLPLVHHVIGTDGYFYISDSDNFFARSTPLQLGIWSVATALAVGLRRLRVR